MRLMQIRRAVQLTLIVTGTLISGETLFAQDTPIGDVARQARAEKAQAAHAKKAVTDEDLGPQLAPVSETDDPAQVVNKARRAWMTDMPRSCREFSSNNSGPGSSNESLREMAAPDHTRIVVERRSGSDPGHTELIVIGSDMYSRKALDRGEKTRRLGSLDYRTGFRNRWWATTRPESLNWSAATPPGARQHSSTRPSLTPVA
jgi:hypothetical protein